MRPEEQDFLTQLYWNNFEKLVGYVRYICHARGLAEDYISDLAENVIQDVFHTAAKKISVLISHPKPDAWLMITCKHKLQEHTRQAMADKQCLLFLETMDRDLSNPSSNLIAAQQKLEYDDSLNRIHRLLSEEEFRLFDMIVLRRTGYRRAARELDISLWASQKRMERIRDKLRSFLPW